MREIEIKVSLSDKGAFLKKIAGRGIEISSPIAQRDRVFGMIGVDGSANNAAPWLRVRTETREGKMRQIFTLKKSVTNQWIALSMKLRLPMRMSSRKLLSI